MAFPVLFKTDSPQPRRAAVRTAGTWHLDVVNMTSAATAT
jgi:hypothetical protein